MITIEKWYNSSGEPASKPNGQMGWNFTPGCGGGTYIDLSVMPLPRRNREA